MGKRKEHAAQAGEAGHQGPDRQPGKRIGQAGGAAPGPEEAGSEGQVKSRSRQAQRQPKGDQKDRLHPDTGSGRPRLPHVG